MLLFLFRMYSDVAKLCAIEEIREFSTAKRRYRALQSVWKRKLV
jgi:hypothetical protein